MNNTEINNKIQELTKKLEYFKQSLEPNKFRYIWQLWYDKIEKKTKVWTWEITKSVGWLKYFSYYFKKTYWAGSSDIKITTWFKPKYVFIASSYFWWFNWTSDSWIVDTWTNIQVTTTYQVYGYADKKTFETWDKSSIPCVYVYRDSTRRQVLYIKSFDEDWFTMQHWYNWTNDANIHIFAIW